MLRDLWRRAFAALYIRFDRSSREQWGHLRSRLVGDLEGEVLEVGAGTGATFEHYRPGVTVIATDRNEHMLRRAQPSADRSPAQIRLERADADRLPFADARFDAVVSSLVLCSVPDQQRALAEMRRVLRPGGRLRLFEHVVSTRRPTAAAQRVVSPAWSLFADGCRLHRDTVAAVRSADFRLEDVEELPLGLPLRFVLIAAFRPEGQPPTPSTTSEPA